MDDPIYDIELEDCPICRGAGLIQAAWSAGRFQPGRPSLWPRKHSFFSVIAF